MVSKPPRTRFSDSTDAAGNKTKFEDDRVDQELSDYLRSGRLTVQETFSVLHAVDHAQKTRKLRRRTTWSPDVHQLARMPRSSPRRPLVRRL